MPTAYLNLGSNMGDRQALIEQAVALISDTYPEARIRRSKYIESEPWGFASPHPFLNLGIALDFEVLPDPYRLLHDLQGIERTVGSSEHRNPDGSYRDRHIDIDIIEIDGVEITSPTLTVPHPRATKRDFVMIPLNELKMHRKNDAF